MNNSQRITETMDQLKANFKIWSGKITGNKFQELDGYNDRINAYNRQQSRITENNILKLNKTQGFFDGLIESIQEELHTQQLSLNN